MEFDDSSDEEFLQELFGEDAPSLFEYVMPVQFDAVRSCRE